MFFSSAYIVNKKYDFIFFLGAPIFALILAHYFFFSSPALSWMAILGVRVFTQAHIVMVFSRSHLNTSLFKSFPFRFTLVPVLLLITLLISDIFLLVLVVLSSLWDIYHSSLQTFGLARIYDQKLNNPSTLGRMPDIILAHYIYIGAYLFGIDLSFASREILPGSGIQSSLMANAGQEAVQHLAWLQNALIYTGLPFLIFYIYYYLRCCQRGYTPSIQKVALYFITGVVCYYSWCHLPYLTALFVVNFFHALQYFAILYWSEKRNLISVFSKEKWKKFYIMLVIMCFGYGLLIVNSRSFRFFVCLGTTLSLMHYWYDGFIWSVRRKQI